MATERFEHNFPGYEILAQLGRGNARVLKARNQVTGELVAIKHFAINTDADTLKRFQRESVIMNVLKHPNIVKIKEIRLEAPLPYIVMELIEGGDLRNLLKQRGNLDKATVVDLGIQLSRALDLIHRNGIVHRDIKPENIMFRVLPNQELHFLLTDFGIAKLREQSHTITGTSMMTYEYASPEQFDDPKSVTSATDFYSLGVVMYECLTGQVPFPLGDLGMVPFIQKIMIESPPAIPLLPSSLDQLIKGLLSKTKEARITDPDQIEKLLLYANGNPGAINRQANKLNEFANVGDNNNHDPNKYRQGEGVTEKRAGAIHRASRKRRLSPGPKLIFVFGFIGAAIMMLFYLGNKSHGNDYPITQQTFPADTPTSITNVMRDTAATIASVNRPVTHQRVIPPTASNDTITTTVEYPDGKYVGQVVGSVRNGLGTFFWNDGDRYSGYFVNGEKEGKGTFYYKNRDLYIGDWKNGKKNGIGILYTNELTYEGGFADDYFDGFGTLNASEKRIVTNCPDCRTYKGYWRDDLKEGFGECFDKDGHLLYQGQFADDEPVDVYPNVEKVKNEGENN